MRQMRTLSDEDADPGSCRSLITSSLRAVKTKTARAAAKERGTKLGNPNGAAPLLRAAKGNGAAVGVLKTVADHHASALTPEVAQLRAEGCAFLPALAKALNEWQILTHRGGKWHPSSVSNLLKRLPQAA